MASHGTGRNGATMGLMKAVICTALILWLCSGLCVCEEEGPDTNYDPEGTVMPDTPVEDQPEGVREDDSPDDGGSSPSQLQDQEEGWAPNVVTEDTLDSTVLVPDDETIEDVDDQSEAPQGEDESSQQTEQPVVEPEETPVASQKPAEPTDQPVNQERGDFIMRNDNGVICLRACFAALLTVDYVGQDEDGEMVNRTAEIPVPEKADVDGSCERGPSEESALELQWNDDTYGLTITFRKQNATIKGDPNYWEASRIQFTFDTRDSNYFDAAVNAGTRTVHTSPSATFFATPQGNSRICQAEDDITMLPSAVDKTERVTLEISQLQMQPYGMVNGTFSEGVDCGEDLLENPNTNVASIAVGATLACLILIVIIVYAVGRKMGAINDRSGYKSVE